MNGYKRHNVVWATKLLKSKNFVVMTDDESTVSIDAAPSGKLSQTVTLQYQRSTLQLFDRRLHGLIKKHDKVLERLHDPQRGKSATKSRKGTV